jgi:hypothetical protein
MSFLILSVLKEITLLESLCVSMDFLHLEATQSWKTIFIKIVVFPVSRFYFGFKNPDYRYMSACFP